MSVEAEALASYTCSARASPAARDVPAAPARSFSAEGSNRLDAPSLHQLVATLLWGQAAYKGRVDMSVFCRRFCRTDIGHTPRSQFCRSNLGRSRSQRALPPRWLRSGRWHDERSGHAGLADRVRLADNILVQERSHSAYRLSSTYTWLVKDGSLVSRAVPTIPESSDCTVNRVPSANLRDWVPYRASTAIRREPVCFGCSPARR